MGAINNSMERQVQELILDYFKDMDDKTVYAVINSIVYFTPITDKKSNVSKIIEKFLEENGLTTAYMNYMIDYTNPSRYINRASGSEIDMIEKVRYAFLNLACNRYRDLIEKRETKVNNFYFLKKTILEVFECLNNNENYIYGIKEDEKLVKKVEKMTMKL